VIAEELSSDIDLPPDPSSGDTVGTLGIIFGIVEVEVKVIAPAVYAGVTPNLNRRCHYLAEQGIPRCTGM